MTEISTALERMGGIADSTDELLIAQDAWNRAQDTSAETVDGLTDVRNDPLARKKAKEELLGDMHSFAEDMIGRALGCALRSGEYSTGEMTSLEIGIIAGIRSATTFFKEQAEE